MGSDPRARPPEWGAALTHSGGRLLALRQDPLQVAQALRPATSLLPARQGLLRLPRLPLRSQKADVASRTQHLRWDTAQPRGRGPEARAVGRTGVSQRLSGPQTALPAPETSALRAGRTWGEGPSQKTDSDAKCDCTASRNEAWAAAGITRDRQQLPEAHDVPVCRSPSVSWRPGSLVQGAEHG